LFDALLPTEMDAGAPATKFTVAVLDSGAVPRLALTTAGPAVVADVSVAVYVPFDLSATAPRVPRVVDIVTVPRLSLSGAPVESLRTTEISVVVLPSATSEVCDAVTVDVCVDASGPASGPVDELQLIVIASTAASAAILRRLLIGKSCFKSILLDGSGFEPSTRLR
jgi:hypothetical protein